MKRSRWASSSSGSPTDRATRRCAGVQAGLPADRLAGPAAWLEQSGCEGALLWASRRDSREHFRGYGGFAALRRYVPTLKKMGIDLLWLMPIWEHGDGSNGISTRPSTISASARCTARRTS